MEKGDIDGHVTTEGRLCTVSKELDQSRHASMANNYKERIRGTLKLADFAELEQEEDSHTYAHVCRHHDTATRGAGEFAMPLV